MHGNIFIVNIFSIARLYQIIDLIDQRSLKQFHRYFYRYFYRYSLLFDISFYKKKPDTFEWQSRGNITIPIITYVREMKENQSHVSWLIFSFWCLFIFLVRKLWLFIYFLFISNNKYNYFHIYCIIIHFMVININNKIEWYFSLYFFFFENTTLFPLLLYIVFLKYLISYVEVFAKEKDFSLQFMVISIVKEIF